MITVEQARQQILSHLPRLAAEEVPLIEALGRFTAGEVRSRRRVPGFDNSAFDGYAVHSADVAAASAAAPVRLRVIGVAPAGSAPGPAFAAGSCVRIFTGAPMPAGADAVVMQEDTRRGGEESVEVLDRVGPWEGLRMAGEDFEPGALLAAKGQSVTPALLALMASAGVGTVAVGKRPRVQLVSTGSELVEPGHELEPGQIHDSNGVLLEALARQEGAEVTGRERIADQPEATVRSLDRASSRADVIITTGGVSVGDADLLRPSIVAAGGRVDLWRIAMKPGKPFAFGRLGEAVWFGLPGNPVSAFVTWKLLVRPALRHLAGAAAHAPPRIRARLGQPFANRGDRRHFVRVVLGADGEVRVAGTQASHLQSSLAAANGLLDVPPATLWEVGREVEVELFD